MTNLHISLTPPATNASHRVLAQLSLPSVVTESVPAPPEVRRNAREKIEQGFCFGFVGCPAVDWPPPEGHELGDDWRPPKYPDWVPAASLKELG